jgi:hypothetical protein
MITPFFVAAFVAATGHEGQSGQTLPICRRALARPTKLILRPGNECTASPLIVTLLPYWPLGAHITRNLATAHGFDAL